MYKMRPLGEARTISPMETAHALDLVSDIDLHE
jgi:hypothetical protein